MMKASTKPSVTATLGFNKMGTLHHNIRIHHTNTNAPVDDTDKPEPFYVAQTTILLDREAAKYRDAGWRKSITVEGVLCV